MVINSPDLQTLVNNMARRRTASFSFKIDSIVRRIEKKSSSSKVSESVDILVQVSFISCLALKYDLSLKLGRRRRFLLSVLVVHLWRRSRWTVSEKPLPPCGFIRGQWLGNSSYIPQGSGLHLAEAIGSSGHIL